MRVTPTLHDLKKPGFAAVVGSLLMLIVVAYAWILDGAFPDFYYQSVQEDEAMEWATFWAFVLAAAVFVVCAVGHYRTTGLLPWFFVGVGLFCVFVAGEEISWGQRVIGYLPPEYFLANNFQQEFNVHNVAASSLRRLALKGVILGYGVVLPLLAVVPFSRRILQKLGVFAPTWPLVPGFIATYIVYDAYPWKFSGEWVEFMLGLGFLFAGVIHAHEGGWRLPGMKRFHNAAIIVSVAWLATMILGVANAAVSRAMLSGSPELLDAARTELEALQSDFESGLVGTRCDLHKRLYAFRSKYSQDHLLEGEFAALTAQGLPEARAEFLLDPWNSPYWLRDRCRDDERVVFIYSFGPDRRRQSSRWEILGDDVGVNLSLED